MSTYGSREASKRPRKSASRAIWPTTYAEITSSR